MNSLDTFLLLCSVFSALTVSGVYSQDLEISVDPPKPSLSGSIFINCTADVLSKKIVSLGIFRGKEEILTFKPSKRPRIIWPDESLKSRFTFNKSLKKQTILSLELKNPRCTDQNVYKCVLNQAKKEPQNAEKRVDFYVQKQGVTLTENKATNCLDIDITCVGHAGNPPEHMGWSKKTPHDNEYTRIDPSYVTANMEFHTENCSNTRTERLVYKPTEAEKDLIVKCGFGDMTQEVRLRRPGQLPENVTLMHKGTPEVGEMLDLNCTGKILSSVEYTVDIYKRTELNSEFNKIVGELKDERIVEQDDCMSMVVKVVSYKPGQEDKGLELMCRITAGGKSADAMQVIDVKGLFVVSTGITVDKPDPEGENSDMDDKMDKDEDGDSDDKMSMEVTSAPEPEPEGEDKDEDEEKMVEGEAEKEAVKEEEIVKKAVPVTGENSSGMLLACRLLVIATALLFMA